ncbi:MAG: Ig-like domain-containing protein, partial [Gemmatimonadota bacterium]|nr:Ig-like domain-containing protein [Gemmatimonadota bacterium]
MRTALRFIARTAALAAPLFVGAACTERVLVPQTQAVRLQLELASQVAGGSRTATVRVRYQTASGGLVSLLDQTTTVATGTQQLSVPVDLAKCLADAAHVGGPTTCRLRVTVELRDAASGTLLDTVELAAIDASPGAAPAATSVTVAAVSTVTVTGITSTLIQSQTAQATGVVKDAAGNTLGRPITWATSDAAIAVVSAAGLVSAVAPGTVQIVATSGGVSQATALTVLPAAALMTVTVTGGPALLVGQTRQMIVTLS